MFCSATAIHPDAQAFVIVAGAILGLCAALLWTAQGSMMMAYPTEQQKGRFIAIFWAIFNLGGVVGAAVALGQNIHSETNSGIYLRCKVFMWLDLICFALSFQWNLRMSSNWFVIQLC